MPRSPPQYKKTGRIKLFEPRYFQHSGAADIHYKLKVLDASQHSSGQYPENPQILFKRVQLQTNTLGKNTQKIENSEFIPLRFLEERQHSKQNESLLFLRLREQQAATTGYTVSNINKVHTCDA